MPKLSGIEPRRRCIDGEAVRPRSAPEDSGGRVAGFMRASGGDAEHRHRGQAARKRRATATATGETLKHSRRLARHVCGSLVRHRPPQRAQLRTLIAGGNLQPHQPAVVRCDTAKAEPGTPAAQDTRPPVPAGSWVFVLSRNAVGQHYRVSRLCNCHLPDPAADPAHPSSELLALSRAARRAAAVDQAASSISKHGAPPP